MSAVFEDIAAAVGYTPLVRINKLGSGKAEVLVKLESKNPCGSIKDRIAKYMVEAAQEAGPRRCSSSPPAAIRASDWPSFVPPRAFR